MTMPHTQRLIIIVVYILDIPGASNKLYSGSLPLIFAYRLPVQIRGSPFDNFFGGGSLVVKNSQRPYIDVPSHMYIDLQNRDFRIWQRSNNTCLVILNTLISPTAGMARAAKHFANCARYISGCPDTLFCCWIRAMCVVCAFCRIPEQVLSLCNHSRFCLILSCFSDIVLAKWWQNALVVDLVRRSGTTW